VQAGDDTAPSPGRSIKGFHPPFRLAIHLPSSVLAYGLSQPGTCVHAYIWRQAIFDGSRGKPVVLVAMGSFAALSGTRAEKLLHAFKKLRCGPTSRHGPVPDPTWACCPDARVMPVGAGRTV
jgi:hypothetical protein